MFAFVDYAMDYRSVAIATENLRFYIHSRECQSLYPECGLKSLHHRRTATHLSHGAVAISLRVISARSLIDVMDPSKNRHFHFCLMKIFCLFRQLDSVIFNMKMFAEFIFSSHGTQLRAIDLIFIAFNNHLKYYDHMMLARREMRNAVANCER
jgi:hypothetical protein